VSKKYGIDDVDLYGGTRHSSTTAIGKSMKKNKPGGFMAMIPMQPLTGTVKLENKTILQHLNSWQK
jgi:hypothetical protein